ncbi:MAG: hypothetical protein Q9171_005126 [Xanthocarpia ochracea]
MAEVAVAASAAGLASLGIQCCKGLTTYYNSYKAYDEQIGTSHKQVLALTALFKKLERLLSRNTTNPAQVSQLQHIDKILFLNPDSCRHKLQKLESVLQKCQRTTLPSGKVTLMLKIKSRALFPFREQTLLTVRENVRSLRDDLKFALNIFQTDMAMDQRLSTASLAALSRNTRSDIQAISPPVERINNGVDLFLQHQVRTKTTLSNLQAQTDQNHEATLEVCRSIPERCRLLLQQNRRSSYSLEQKLITALGQDGTERELLRGAIKSFNHKREGESERLVIRIDALVRNLQCRRSGLILN